MAMKAKKKQKSGNGVHPAQHPREMKTSQANQKTPAQLPGAGLSGIGRSLGDLLDRTRAYFRQAEPA
jgi:hypothetical protein